MMLPLVVVACLLVENRPSEPAMDWAFVEAQEQFVLSEESWRTHRVLDGELQSLLVSMGSDNWRHRQWASKTMVSKGNSAILACHVGQNLGDAEVRLRCRNVLRRLSMCRGCDGEGQHKESWGFITCRLCEGLGHFLPTSDFEE